MRTRWAIGSGLAITVLAGIASASIRHSGPAEEIPDVLIARLQTGTVIEQYVAQYVGFLRSLDRDGDGLDRADLALSRDMKRAQARAHAIGEVLAHDLNGDFKVTRAEMIREANGEEPYRSQQVDKEMQRLDADGDGVVTLAEAADSTVEPRNYIDADALLALDPNGDGRLTSEELRRAAERAFASVDRDGDGKISAEEYAVIAERVREIQRAESAPVCRMPPLPAGAKLLVYGGYEGDAVSSVSIGGSDQETNVIDVRIEPGSEPLYLVLTSYESMVWRVSGATARVAHVVVSSQAARESPRDGASASGVAGLPAGKVTIAGPQCPRSFYQPGGEEEKNLVATLRRSLGRGPDGVFGNYSARSVSFPSGRVTETEAEGAAPMPRGFDPEMWREAVRFWPGGLVQVDPKQVIATLRVEPYKVLPSVMGVSQLLGSGALERKGRGFRIVRPIAHMPASMGGAHSVTLYLAKGIPLPPGDPVHSCVISEESGKPIHAGGGCPAD